MMFEEWSSQQTTSNHINKEWSLSKNTLTYSLHKNTQNLTLTLSSYSVHEAHTLSPAFRIHKLFPGEQSQSSV